MNEIRYAPQQAEPTHRSRVLSILIFGLALAALPASLAAGTNPDALLALARGPLVTIEAQSDLGRARLELRPSDYLIEGDRLTWSSEERLALRDPLSGAEIAYLEEISLFYLADPVVGVSFGVVAAGAPTVFSVTSASLSFDPIGSPTARASAAFGLIDRNGDGGASLTGTNVDGQAFQAYYNDVGGVPATGATFATLVSSFAEPASYSSSTSVEELPAAPGYSSTSESGATLPTISSLSSQCQFSLSAFDGAIATTVLVVPEPLGLERLSLSVNGTGGSARVDLPLVERRLEEGVVVWTSEEDAVLRDAGSGRELARVEAGTGVRVADHEITLAFTVTSAGAPVNFAISTGSVPLPVLPSAFARASVALALTDLDGGGATLTGMNSDGQVFGAFYNDIGGVPGTGPAFVTLADGFALATPFSSAAGSFEFESAGVFSQVDESGATLGTVSSASLQMEFAIGALDTASGTSVFALHPGGGVTGRVYLDANGSGAQDPGEPGLAGVDVEITDSQAGVQTVTTDGNGDYQAAAPAGSATVDVDETTLPAGAVQTEGTDPTVVAVPAGGTVSDVDGYSTFSLVEIPTLGGLGLSLLALGLGLAGARRLARRRPRKR